jgi:hypothetical protein
MIPTMNTKISFFAASLVLTILLCEKMYGQSSYVVFQKGEKNFSLSANGKSSSIYMDSNEFPGAVRAVRNLQTDIEKVTGVAPSLLDEKGKFEKQVVIVGTIGKNNIIDDLIKNNKIDGAALKGKWETFLIQVVENPLPNVQRALVIAGSDKRGTIFGIYDLAKQIGVSPWYWWADVPIARHSNVYIKPGKYLSGEPAVKYRGIFINDEEPALGRWAVEKYGGFNHEMYEKVFELILRLKGNYLWPAMWWASFNGDDPINPDLADEYGIVMSTTHHEPMMRAHADWKAYKGSAGPWDYDKNEAKLREFWREGIKRMGSRESIVSMGMRGDGDMAMTAETNIALLERIVADQRKIIADVTGKPVEQTPQMWALYKEVQEYYDRGMRVPDDVTLLLCDDNWGNIRKLPKLTDAPRSGGYGIYYHFDYVGGPRNYKWVNTSHLSRVREQMNLALQYGVDRIWVVNVGDIKPMELPISFFLDFAWDPKPWGAGDIERYTTRWAEQQFGSKYSKEIAHILSTYTKYNSRRKPELLSADTYSLDNYLEAETVVADYNKLAAEAEKIYGNIPAEYKDAYYQLVLYPVVACANLNELWVTIGKNRKYAKDGRATANDLAKRAKELFAKDSVLRYQYNNTLANGKWHHMMDQNHISYTYWQQPEKDVLPEVKFVNAPVDWSKEFADQESKKSSSTNPPKTPGNWKGFAGSTYVSIEAAHFSKSVTSDKIKWQILPDIGRTKDGVSVLPVTAPSVAPGNNTPRLEYAIYLTEGGEYNVQAYFSPTLNFHVDGLRYAMSIDDEAPQIVNIHEGYTQEAWDKWVADNIIIKSTKHSIKPGAHTLKFWMVDSGIVLQKIVVGTDQLKPSYLGPPESFLKK